jgi:hypothetical protein
MNFGQNIMARGDEINIELPSTDIMLSIAETEYLIGELQEAVKDASGELSYEDEENQE